MVYTYKTLFIGIDPGLSGAVAVLQEDGTTYNLDLGVPAIQDWTDVNSMAVFMHSIQDRMDNLLVALEDVHSFPKQGVSGVFNFGVNLGEWKGILAAYNIPYILVTPKAWQSGKKGCSGVLDKVNSKKDIKIQVWEFACRRWPEAELTGPKGGKKFGRSDALCLAEYARKNFSVRMVSAEEI